MPDKPYSERLVPGAPGSEPPSVAEPTDPRGPLAPKSDQSEPAAVSATGATAGERQQQGPTLTTAQGAPLRDTDHSLKAGPRGPVLLQDHHLREKIMHFDHERIPERVVHARGAAAHGTFESNGKASKLTKAAFLASGVKTPVYVRFSTVAGSRGSSDVVRDVRGFATKFYTTEGNYDLVGNNIPIFFIQDGIKFPDLVHAVKPHPDREIPQAQTAHDTFWDFVSLHTEAQAMVMWAMSDRAIPRSFRMMEGFGVHTFRLINDAGETSLVKFHWKPRLGIHSVVWEEAQLINGLDPDFHRRDLADAIEGGALPEWDLGIQVFPDTEDQMFEGIDLLDPTKFVPEELAPVEIIGTMTLNANPTNYFAETEQVAFHPGHLVPGIDVTNDPLLQGRLFSYLDTQLIRLGGPNFSQIPINRPVAPVNDMLRDGYHQQAVHAGVAPYRPNSLDGGCPFTAGDAEAFIDVPQAVEAGRMVREHPATFDDHYSQARLFYRSMSPVEQEHIIGAYTFELGKCYEEAIRVRQLQNLAEIDAELCSEVAAGLGLAAPEPKLEHNDTAEPAQSAALTQLGKTYPVDGRQIGVLVDDDTDPGTIAGLVSALDEAGTVPLLIAPTGGQLGGQVPVQRSYATAASIELDGIVVAGSGAPGPDIGKARDARSWQGAVTIDPRVETLLDQMYRHAKAIAVVSGSESVAEAAGVELGAPGVLVGDIGALADDLLALLGGHRAWERFA